MVRTTSHLRLTACAGAAATALLSAPGTAGPQDTPPNFKVAFIGDQGLGAPARAVLQLALDEGASVIVHLGDFDYANNPAAWQAQIQDVLPPCFPYFAVAGNHDTSQFAGYQQVIQSMLNCAGVQWHGEAGRQFSFTYQGIYFVLTTPGLLGSGDAAYVADRLASPAAQSAIWRISGWHLLMRNMQIGGKGDESGWDVYENSRLGGAIVATAHEHSYERTNLLADMSDQTVSGTDLVISEGRTFAFVSGLGGESVRDQERCLPIAPPYGCGGTWGSIFASQQGGNYGALFIEFNHGGEPCLARGYFKDIGGNVIDEFFIRTALGSCGCPADATGDFVIDQADVDEVFAHWGCTGACAGDVNGDGIVDVRDHLMVLQSWGTCKAGAPAPVAAPARQGRAAPGAPLKGPKHGNNPVAVAPAGPRRQTVGAGTTGGIWISPQELAQRPMEGPAWESLLAVANAPAGPPNIMDQNDDTDVRTMAKALVYARTGVPAYREQVIANCMAAIGTEAGGRTLALGRNLIGYVIAADLVSLPPAEDATFRAWLSAVRFENLQGKTLISTHEDRPNNWGTHAGASRMAADVYLGDVSDLAAAATVFKGWLGDRNAYAGFSYGELWWQADPAAPVGINPVGSTILGYPVDGVLPDDQRRSGAFTWPPPQENYVYEALQGALAQAEILNRQGYDAWNWEDQALRRAFTWLHAQASFPAQGDDTWEPHLVNFRYGTTFPAPVPSNPGKNVGWTDWTHGLGCPCDVNADSVVNQDDIQLVFDHWNCQGSGCAGNVNGDGVVDTRDYLMVLSNWGDCSQTAASAPAPVSIRNPFADPFGLHDEPEADDADDDAPQTLDAAAPGAAAASKSARAAEPKRSGLGRGGVTYAPAPRNPNAPGRGKAKRSDEGAGSAGAKPKAPKGPKVGRPRPPPAPPRRGPGAPPTTDSRPIQQATADDD